jgi:hydrogenase maturation factor
MTVVTGKLSEVYIEEGMSMGKVDVQGVFVKVPLILLFEAKVGDRVLIDSGVAISIINVEQ